MPEIKLNILPSKRLNIIFCLSGTSFSGRFLDSLLNTLHYCNQKGIPYLIVRKESPVVYFVRNMCLGGDVLRGENQKPYNGQISYSHLMWLDNDIIFSPEQFQTLLNYNQDVVSGIYMMSDNIHFAIVKDWNEEYFQKHGTFQFLSEKDISNKKGLMEVDYVGMGFMLIKYGVFESLKYPWFRPLFHNIGKCADFSSEDVSFCLMAKEKGHKIYIDPELRVGHEKKIVL